jgi:transcriptional activator HAC1
VSVGRTTALDGFNPNGFDHISNLGNNTIHDHGFSSYFDAPDPTGADNRFFENGIQPITESFDLNFHNMVDYNDRALDSFNLDDFLLDQDDQPAPEIQSSDSLAEKTANLQPQFGASSLGCDDGGNAVSV